MRDKTCIIDLNKKTYTKLKYKQYDNNVPIVFTIIEDSQAVDLTGYTVGAFFQRADGQIYEKNTSISGSNITTTIDNNITELSATVKVELVFVYGEKTVTSFTVYLDIEDSIDKEEAIMADPQWDAIKALLQGGSGGGGSTSTSASNITITDTAGNFTATNVEDALVELDSQIKDIENLFTTEQVNNNFIIKYNNKVVATIPINGSAINYGSIITSCSETLEINEGNTLDIMVYLSSKPTNNQSIIITTSNSNITTSITEMTFTPDNYSTEQTLTITATHDVSSFDDKSCLLTFASENVESVNISITVKNTDTQQSDYITDGLSLYYDFTETPEDPTTIYDKINNLSIYNSGYTSDSYTENGVYLVNGGGANSFKFGSSSVDPYKYQTMTEFNNFLNKIKEGNGLTIEYFGQYLPATIMYAYNTGLNVGGSGSTGGGYLINYGGLGGANLKYLNTSNEIVAINLNQINKVTKDDQETSGYSADNNADIYLHLVITADETGKLTWYLNGNAMINTATATDFASWDYDTMFKANYCSLLRAGSEDTNRLVYPATSLKVYNRALTQDEIKTNLEYEISRTNFANSASVTP